MLPSMNGLVDHWQKPQLKALCVDVAKTDGHQVGWELRRLIYDYDPADLLPCWMAREASAGSPVQGHLAICSYVEFGMLQ